MDTLCSDIHAFQRKKHHEQRVAGQTAALFLTCGVDLADALSAPRVEKKRIALKKYTKRLGKVHFYDDDSKNVEYSKTLNQVITYQA